MAGVVFVLEFLELVLVFPDEDLGFGEDAGLEVGVEDAGFAFGGGCLPKRRGLTSTRQSGMPSKPDSFGCVTR